MDKGKIVTIGQVPKREYEVLGMVSGSCVKAKSIVTDIFASIKNITGGEIGGYKKLMNEVREKALEEMISEAEALNADAVVCVRYMTTDIAEGVAEIFVYGTAVKFKK